MIASGPGGITLRQEAHFCTTSLLSLLPLIYLLAELLPCQIRSALKRALPTEKRYGNRGKTQIRGGKTSAPNVALGIICGETDGRADNSYNCYYFYSSSQTPRN